ncbi:MAG: cysteine hydrolase [Syntrophales bacterium LBB04]|nr:cysteine hydrolase [Syntrophales bacterium LBB04]
MQIQARVVNFAIEPSKAALVVVDMQNDFVREGAVAYVKDAKRTIPNQQQLIKTCRERAIPIYYTKYVAPRVRTTWTEFVKALVDPPTKLLWAGTKRYYSDVGKELEVTDIIDELAPTAEDYVVEKHWYDGFFETPLESYLKARGVKYPIFVGTATDVCVDATTKGAYFRQFYPVVVTDAVSAQDPEVEATVLKLLHRRYARIATTDEIIVELKT